ncbi:hypothetical protein Taro_025061, partial [Colocasia esculenta]|nr:hypothetical protein [Colocasia esculenta]
SELLTGDSRVAVGNYVLCQVLLETEWVAGRLVPTVGSVGGCSHLVLLGTCGVVVPVGRPTCGWSKSLVFGLVLHPRLEHVVSSWVSVAGSPCVWSSLCEPLVFQLYVLRACLAVRLLQWGGR